MLQLAEIFAGPGSSMLLHLTPVPSWVLTRGKPPYTPSQLRSSFPWSWDHLLTPGHQGDSFWVVPAPQGVSLETTDERKTAQSVGRKDAQRGSLLSRSSHHSSSDK